MPSFILATLLQYFLAIKLQIFPVALWESSMHTVFPALALAAAPMANIAQTNAFDRMLEVLAMIILKQQSQKV